ncbi:hypothetical protein H0H87_005516 [Tephrocybe sp. NHM501043]|nr:hypothetical protein H0H87_005516 [Tephrocybe sp. NHM501043]
MDRIPFAFLERVESVFGTISSISTQLPDLGHHGRKATTTKDITPWCAQRPYIQKADMHSGNKKRRIDDIDRESLLIEGMDDAKTLVSVSARACKSPYYALPSAPVVKYVLGEKILPNIACYDFDTEEEASDSDTFYSYDGSLLLEPKSSTVAVEKLNPQLAAAIPELIEVVTALSPPSLRHSGRTRSKVVSISRDSPGTCP